MSDLFLLPVQILERVQDYIFTLLATVNESVGHRFRVTSATDGHVGRS